MATTTPNFGWAVPTSTDLVKDGAVAIETLGDSIDASLVDLKGGTTGQVLKKNTNTDMDFVWSSDAAGMTNPMTTTGDTIYSSSGSTPARLGIGSTGNVLTVSGGVPVWAAPAGGGQDFTLINAGGTSLTGSSVTVSFSGKNQIFIYFTGASSTTGSDMFFQYNSDSTTKYNARGLGFNSSFSWSTENQTNATNTYLGYTTTNGGTLDGTLLISGANATGIKPIEYFVNGASQGQARIGQGFYTGTSALTSVTFNSAGSNFDAGTIFVYGA